MLIYKQACILEINITQYETQPSIILGLDNIVYVFGINTTHIIWDDQCRHPCP
jgi:hypothetical protein